MTTSAPAAGRVALVTGGNRGLGLEVCRVLVGRGLRVLLGARDAEKGRSAAERFGMSADRLRVVPMDVASAELEAQADGALREFGVIDVLVNNAAIHYDTWQTASTADMTTVREAFETNLFGAWRLARSLAAPMKRRGYGRIVNVSSGAGSLSDMGGGTPAYSVSKAALNALTCCLAGELSGTGVLVNSVCPGWVATEMGGAGGRPIPEGAAGIVWAATLPEGGPTGGFFRDGVRLAW
jgi:NAD(P)-dependent dehydrogenase (short-subunit alcohol dehydrogenase family)